MVRRREGGSGEKEVGGVMMKREGEAVVRRRT